MDTTTVVNPMVNAVTSALSTVIDWVGTVITALTSSNGELSGLLPLFAIGIAISALLLGVKVIRSFTWGN